MFESDLQSSIYLLKGTVYQAMDNHQFAAQYFRMALKVNYLDLGLVLLIFLTYIFYLLGDIPQQARPPVELQ